MIAILSHFAVDENQHMLSNLALFIEHVCARARFASTLATTRHHVGV